jgi:hypothetical protein
MNKATAGQFSDGLSPPRIVSLAIMVASMDAAISASALRSWMQATRANRWDTRDPATIEAPTSKGHPYGSPLSWGSSATGGVSLAGWSTE